MLHDVVILTHAPVSHRAVFTATQRASAIKEKCPVSHEKEDDLSRVFKQSRRLTLLVQ